MSDRKALNSVKDDNYSSGSTLSKLRIVLVGKTGSGKSSAGNTILGPIKTGLFKTVVSPKSCTKTCEKKTTDDRIISVIDTPGLFDTEMPEQDMETEIVKCIEMSVPGPHVFLLVIRLCVKYTAEEKNTVKWIQKNFGEQAACYTIILFTHTDDLDGKPLDEYISESDDLKALVSECNDRFHSFNNKDKKNRDQVTELLKKIEKMVEKNGQQHYTNIMYQEAQRKKNIEQFWSMEPTIVLLGKSGSGKTKTRKNFVGIEGRNSTNSATETCEKQDVCMAEKKMKIIDTPRLIDASEEKMKNEIEKLVNMSPSGPYVFLLVIKLGRFIDEDKNITKWIEKNFGEDVLDHTIILFTHADQLMEKSLDEYIRDTPDLQEFTKRFGSRFHSFNNEDTENREQVSELLKNIEKMVERNDWRCYTSQLISKAQRRKLFWSGKPRFVLLGKPRSGKSTTGNTIVGKKKENFMTNPKDFATKSTKLHKADVNGKRMKIIDTPGLTDASKKQKNEIFKFVKQSAPSPVVFLLVIRLDMRLTENEKKIVRWIQEKFGVEGARNTIVLFTHDDALERNPLEDHIRKNNDLQALVKDCGGRYHSFNNKDMANHSQVQILQEKIEEMMERSEEEHNTDEMNQDTQMILGRSQFWSENPWIVLLGETGSGKTSAVETIVGRESFTKTCKLQEACVAGKNVTIIDTPGLTDASEKIKNEIKQFVRKYDPGPLVFLLVIRLDEIFTDEERNTVNWIQKNFGEGAACHTIVLFTHADHLRGKSIHNYISERGVLQSLIKRCSGIHLFNNQDRNDQNQVVELLKISEKIAEGSTFEGYTDEKCPKFVKSGIYTLRNIAVGAGSTGTAAIIAGGIVLGVTDVILAPAIGVAVGIAAVVGAAVVGGLAIHKMFATKDKDV